MNSSRWNLVSTLVAAVAFAGTLFGNPGAGAQSIDEREQQLEARERQLLELERELESRLRSIDANATPAALMGSLSAAGLPPAEPGQCFARVQIPARFETATDQVLVRDASFRIEVAPPRYEMVDERVVVKQASSKLVEVPATYRTVQEEVEIEPARTVWRMGEGARGKLVPDDVLLAARALGLPSTATPGTCFAEYRQYAEYEEREERVLIREASEKIEVIPPSYQWVDQKVLVREASERLVEVPAVYETVQERVLVTPATKKWKKGRGPIERLDHATGEIMCLVEVPAVYKTVSKRVLKTPPTVQRIAEPAEFKTIRARKLVKPAGETRTAIPAQFKTISKRVKVQDASIRWSPLGAQGIGEPTGRKLCGAELPAKTRTVTRQVIDTPASTRTVEIPAEYQTVRKRRLVSPGEERRIEIPAEYEALEQRVKISEAEVAWRPVLCETNASPTFVADLQRALKRSGYDPGEIDGVIGSNTLAAVGRYQRDHELARGGLTMATVEALGLKLSQR